MILGVSTGAGVLIVSGQLAAFLGVGRDPPNWFWGVPADIVRIWPHLREVDLLSVIVGVATIGLMVAARR